MKLVLVVYADRDLSIMAEAAQMFDSVVRDSKVVLVKDAAHMLNMEKPDEFNRIVLDFLK
jgi:pimeloyl-ACP methyl ester carboxylesterase